GGVGANYTPEDWDRAIRHGVAKDGRRLIIMPSQNYASMSDADFRAVAAYLATLPAASSTLPARKVGVLGRVLIGTGAFPLAARTIAHDSVGLVSPVAASGPVYGKYLVTLATCADCHGADFRGRTGQPAGPDIRSIAAKWSVDDFRKTIRTGVDPTGRILNPELMPWKFYAKMTDDELADVWAYIGEVARKP
ncbi:MAG: c-type cytochrome, partial [bacterium]